MFLEIIQTVPAIPEPLQKKPTWMCEFIKQKKLALKKEKSKSSKTQIKPLLSKNIELPKNLKYD